MAEPARPSCVHCVHSSRADSYLTCRRFPPVDARGQWPAVSDDAVCGEWSAGEVTMRSAGGMILVERSAPVSEHYEALAFDSKHEAGEAWLDMQARMPRFRADLDVDNS